MRKMLSALALVLLAGPASAAIDLKPCHPPGVKEELRCGVFVVPENYAHPEGRKLSLDLIVIGSTRVARG